MVKTKTYQFTNVRENHTISAEFTNMMTITFDYAAQSFPSVQYKTSASGTWTGIPITDKVDVAYGGTIYVKASPASGLVFADAKVYDSSHTLLDTLTPTNNEISYTPVTGDITIELNSGNVPNYDVTFNYNNGTVQDGVVHYRKGTSGNWINATDGLKITVAQGTELYFKVNMLNTNKEFDNFVWAEVGGGHNTQTYTKDGRDGDVYKIIDVDSTITINFKLKPCITASVVRPTGASEDGGTISPSGDVYVSTGSSRTFTITASSGFKIKEILVDGSPIQL